MTPDRRKRVSQLSGGMQRRVALAASLVHDPELIFLDEPTAGIDPILRQRFWDHFRELRDEGRTLVVSTQYVGEAAYCDLVAVLAHGHLVMMDTPENLRRRAFGGEMVDVTMPGPPPASVIEVLRTMPGVTRRMPQPDDCTVRLVVEQASEFIPRCVGRLHELGLDAAACQEHLADLDEVFVRIVETDEAAMSDRAAAARA